MHQGGVLGDSEGVPVGLCTPTPVLIARLHVECGVASTALRYWIDGFAPFQARQAMVALARQRCPSASHHVTMSCSRAGLVNLDWLHSTSGAFGECPVCGATVSQRLCLLQTAASGSEGL